MPVESEITTKKDKDGKDIPVFNVSFTNGGMKQLEELKQFFSKESLLEVIELGISVLQKVKETEPSLKTQKKKKDTPDDASPETKIITDEHKC